MISKMLLHIYLHAFVVSILMSISESSISKLSQIINVMPVSPVSTTGNNNSSGSLLPVITISGDSVLTEPQTPTQRLRTRLKAKTDQPLSLLTASNSKWTKGIKSGKGKSVTPSTHPCESSMIIKDAIAEIQEKDRSKQSRKRLIERLCCCVSCCLSCVNEKSRKNTVSIDRPVIICDS